MQPVKVYSAQAVGLRPHVITIEVDLFKGFHSFSVVGLADKAVEESRDRLSSAIKSIGFTSPKARSQKVVVSLAPADLKKEGPLFDLPMALGYLLARDDIRFNPAKKLFFGELALGGELRPIKGALLLARKAREAGFEEIYLPHENAEEAALIDSIRVFGARHLKEVVAHVTTKRLDPIHIEEFAIPKVKLTPHPRTKLTYDKPEHTVDMSDITEQSSAKHALKIAAAGGHNVCFYGPPGTGKTLLAKAFASILPPLQFEDALEVTGIHSLAGEKQKMVVTSPPFRAPHHTSSHISIIGGGVFPRPGEITLAHKGVLFLDEFPEFDRRVIESLRGPLEEGYVSISRARGNEIFPADCILIAALNPCPCGYRGDPRKECSCTQGSIMKYRRKVSGPIVDRIDMWVHVPRIDQEKLSSCVTTQKEKKKSESEEMREEVCAARLRQRERFKRGESRVSLNSRMNVRDLKNIKLPQATKRELDTAARSLDLSARAYHRVMKLARTIADINGSDEISAFHVREALQYRPRDLFL